MIENLWPKDLSTTKTINTPKELLEQQAQYLQNQTNKILYANLNNIISSVSKNSSKYNFDFCFEFSINSKKIQNYQFVLFKLQHNIEIYPLNLILDDKIAKELGYEDNELFVNNETEFISKLSSILKSNRVHQIVTNLISLSN